MDAGQAFDNSAGQRNETQIREAKVTATNHFQSHPRPVCRKATAKYKGNITGDTFNGNVEDQ